MAKKKARRPMSTAVHTHPMQTRVSDDFLSKLDEWRRSEPDLPNRSEAIRRIVERFLAGETANHKKPRK
jgi:metal-responsive CopG/Arc/MetJ family transcriptional regulator